MAHTTPPAGSASRRSPHGVLRDVVRAFHRDTALVGTALRWDSALRWDTALRSHLGIAQAGGEPGAHRHDRHLTARVGEGLVAVVAMGPAGARLAAALRDAEVEQGVPAERGVPASALSQRSAVPTRAVSRWNARTTSRTPCGSPRS